MCVRFPPEGGAERKESSHRSDRPVATAGRAPIRRLVVVVARGVVEIVDGGGGKVEVLIERRAQQEITTMLLHPTTTALSVCVPMVVPLGEREGGDSLKSKHRAVCMWLQSSVIKCLIIDVF